jgi:hypothetical protein
MAMDYANDGMLVRCMQKWVAAAAEGKDFAEKVKTAALKFFGSLTLKCFHGWVKYTYTMLRVKEIMGRGLHSSTYQLNLSRF